MTLVGCEFEPDCSFRVEKFDRTSSVVAVNAVVITNSMKTFQFLQRAGVDLLPSSVFCCIIQNKTKRCKRLTPRHQETFSCHTGCDSIRCQIWENVCGTAAACHRQTEEHSRCSIAQSDNFSDSELELKLNMALDHPPPALKGISLCSHQNDSSWPNYLVLPCTSTHRQRKSTKPRFGSLRWATNLWIDCFSSMV